MRKITEIVVHCSATPAGRNVTAKDIDKWHRDKGWSSIGYHFVILLDGTIQVGRPIVAPGAHVQNHNATTIGICLIGGLGPNGRGLNTFNAAQMESLHSLVHDLKVKFKTANVCGHRDFSPDKNKDGKITPNEFMKDCPSFDVRLWWYGGHGTKGNAL
ncbi:MAG: N-acetylmuramoyl-L-alanine amidase [Bacteroidota bacterium]